MKWSGNENSEGFKGAALLDSQLRLNIEVKYDCHKEFIKWGIYKMRYILLPDKTIEFTTSEKTCVSMDAVGA